MMPFLRNINAMCTWSTVRKQEYDWEVNSKLISHSLTTLLQVPYLEASFN